MANAIKEQKRYTVNLKGTGIIDYHTHHEYEVPQSSDQVLLVSMLNEMYDMIAHYTIIGRNTTDDSFEHIAASEQEHYVGSDAEDEVTG